MSQKTPSGLGRFVANFTDLLSLPRALWLVIGAFVVESMAYFGVLTLMSEYLSSQLHWGDKWAGIAVSLFTGTVTLLMLGAGSLAEGLGVRKAIVLSLILTVLGRLLYVVAGGTGVALGVVVVLASLLITATGDAILQPVCYAGIKQYTDSKTSSMGYAMIYAFMNLGIVVMGALSAWLRPAVQDLLDGRAEGQPGAVVSWMAGFSGSGVQAVNWASLAINALALVLFVLLMTRRTEASMVRSIQKAETPDEEKPSLGRRLKSYFTKGPFSNARFVFFIFMMLPVRTLFAHQWLTMPQYIMRAYDKGVADRMEWLVNWINPMIIFLFVPVLTALTKRMPVYTVMLVGSLVSAVPTFLLCAGPNLGNLITYFVVFSLGEALWSARFLEFSSELAPAGRVAQYMGLANVPWLLAKATTGLYSGFMLSTYCPAGLPPEQTQTGSMWLIYGCIAMTTPVGLFLARGWVLKGLGVNNEGGKAETVS